MRVSRASLAAARCNVECGSVMLLWVGLARRPLPTRRPHSRRGRRRIIYISTSDGPRHTYGIYKRVSYKGVSISILSRAFLTKSGKSYIFIYIYQHSRPVVPYFFQSPPNVRTSQETSHIQRKSCVERLRAVTAVSICSSLRNTSATG